MPGTMLVRPAGAYSFIGCVCLPVPAFPQHALGCLKPDGVFSMNIIWTLPEVRRPRGDFVCGLAAL